ncbi:MAG: PIG-L family deacetylase [Patescibacteria group bacterium]|nr:PIG-L family deacetylase [Patescibacteria group bacterium]
MSLFTEQVKRSLDSFPKRKETSLAVSSVLTRMRQSDMTAVTNLLYGSLSQAEMKTVLATPAGFGYEPIRSQETVVRSANVGYFGPHPSDMVDFLGGTVGLLKRGKHFVYEFLLTEGEKGIDRVPGEIVRKIRRIETKKAADLQGIRLHYLRVPEGGMLPDGELLSHIDSLTYIIKGAILSRKLDIIFAPAPELDHPDHVAVNIAVIRAITQLAQSGYFKNRKLPALYLTDPEFGYASGGEWAMQKVQSIYPGNFITRRGRELPTDIKTMLIAVDSEIETAIEALYMHGSQMKYGDGRAKEYAEMIPALKRLLGTRIHRGFAERFRQVHIPGVTAVENNLLPLIPEGNVFQMKQATQHILE